MDKPKRLRWRREAQAKGLLAMVQGERCYELWYGDEEIGRVAVLYQDFRRLKQLGYYWHALGANTALSPVSTIEEAKSACEDYVREKLGLPARKGKSDATPTD